MDRRWYAVRIVGGKEDRVREILRKVIQRKGAKVEEVSGTREREVVISSGGREKFRLNMDREREIEVMGKGEAVSIKVCRKGVYVGGEFISQPGDRVVVDGVEVKIEAFGVLPSYIILSAGDPAELLGVIERVPYLGKRMLPLKEEEVEKIGKSKPSSGRIKRIEEGSYVEVILGEFKGFRGRVVRIEEGAAEVKLSILGEEKEVRLPVVYLKIL